MKQSVVEAMKIEVYMEEARASNDAAGIHPYDAERDVLTPRKKKGSSKAFRAPEGWAGRNVNPMGELEDD